MSITDLEQLFAQPDEPLPDDVAAELLSIARLHSISEQELFYKWEAYSMKLGTENTHLNYKTVRDFKKDLQDALERESRGKVHLHSATKKAITSTPRPAATGDVYGVLDVLAAGTPRTAIKRRNDFETPSTKATKTGAKSSPRTEANLATPDTFQTSFADRPNPGHVLEAVNSDMIPDQTDFPGRTESRVKLKANTDLAKFNYKNMAMKLSEASEILDDRIDEFAALVQQHHGFPDAAFGNPAARSTSEIIAVGRIASDSEGSINTASLVLESSRRMGAGLRVPLKADHLAYDFFPGKIVAVKGTNATGESFKVSEIIPLPLLTTAASKLNEIEAHNSRLATVSTSNGTAPLSLMIASGPFTPDTDLSYSALHELLSRAADRKVDVLILTGPFIDCEHPLIESGDFSLPESCTVSPDRATLTDAFKAFISQPLARLAESSPSTTIVLVPSVRDAVLKHVSWPQDRLPKKELGLPKSAVCVTNPITLSINEILIAISSQDVLYEMQRQLVTQGSKGIGDDLLERLTAAVIQQRHFFPVFPPLDPEKLPRPAAYKGADEPRVATGACLDTSYLKLGELHIRPDLLIVPSALSPFVKVIERVVAVNPGSLSKRRAAGSFAEMQVLPRVVKEEETQDGRLLDHELFNRARVDVLKI